MQSMFNVKAGGTHNTHCALKKKNRGSLNLTGELIHCTVVGLQYTVNAYRVNTTRHNIIPIGTVYIMSAAVRSESRVGTRSVLQ
jgi:hypothetical protein